MSGMRTKLRDIFVDTSKQLYDAVVLVETWLNSDFFDGEIFDLELYNVYRNDRDSNITNRSRGGGVLIAVKRCYLSARVSLKAADIEQLCVKVNASCGDLFIFTSYIPPGSEPNIYIKHVDNVTEVLRAASQCEVQACVLGDFNLPLIDWCRLDDEDFLVPLNVHSEHDSYLIDNFSALNLYQVNTHVNSLNRILDLVFVNFSLKFGLSICEFPMSKTVMHHCALVLDIENYMFRKIIGKGSSRFNFKLGNYDSINNDLEIIDWDIALSSRNASESFVFFRHMFIDSCNSHIPKCSVRSYKLPWHTKGISSIKNLKCKYYKLFKRFGFAIYYSRYKHFGRIYSNYNRHLYNLYCARMENNIKSNPSAFWNYIRSKKRLSNYPSNMFFGSLSAKCPGDIANLFAEMFIANYNSSTSQSMNINPMDFDNIISYLDCGGLSVTPEEVFNVLCKLKNSKTLDVDGVSPFLLKKCASPLSIILSNIFNKSLAEGVFIDQWKVTKITPILKSGNKCDICNYRPICKTSNISKIFESVIKVKLVFMTKSVITTHQHGFFKGRSTISNLACFTNYCANVLDNGGQLDVIYTDFSKAFDKVSHEILLIKLRKMGFHSNFHLWLQSYLSSRSCCVSVDGALSRSFIPPSGVPQGSILGPLLFILFINDVNDCFNNVLFLLYADDLKIFKDIRCFNDSTLLQSDLDNFVNWCEKNHLSLNVNKCFHMSFTRRRSITHTAYRIGDSVLSSKNSVLDLGIMFDKKLSFVDHINYILPKAYKVLAFIRRNSKDFSDILALKSLYFAFVRSIVEYGAIIWSPVYASQCHRVERVQNIFIKFVLNSIRFPVYVSSYVTRCLLFGLNTLEVRRKMMSVMFIYDVVNGLIDSPYLLSCINFTVPSRILRKSSIFSIKFLRTNFARNEPIARSLALVNSLYISNDIDLFCSRSKFKSVLLFSLSSS